jgi:hypothetical protein
MLMVDDFCPITMEDLREVGTSPNAEIESYDFVCTFTTTMGARGSNDILYCIMSSIILCTREAQAHG